VDKIVSLRKQTNYGPERLQFHLQHQYGLHLAKSTIGHILKRENLIPPKGSKLRKKHPRRYQMPNPGDLIQMDVKYLPYRIKANSIINIPPWMTAPDGDSPKSIMSSPSIIPKRSSKNG
jgi:hypothetical protein